MAQPMWRSTLYPIEHVSRFRFQGFSPTLFVHLCHFFYIERDVTSLWKCSETEVESVMFSCATHLLTKSIPPRYRISQLWAALQGCPIVVHGSTGGHRVYFSHHCLTFQGPGQLYGFR